MSVLSYLAPAINISALFVIEENEAFIFDGTYTPSGSPSHTSVVLLPIESKFWPSTSIFIVPVAGTIQVSYPGVRYSKDWSVVNLTILKKFKGTLESLTSTIGLF